MSQKVLFVKGTPLPAGPSRSTEVAEAFIKAYQEANPTDVVVVRDLFAGDVPFIDGDVLSAWGKYGAGETPTDVEASKAAAFKAWTDEFVAADKVVVQSSMWNLSVAPQVKAWLDTICVAGTTFNYTAEGPVGLATDKKAIHIHGAGGVYSSTTGVEHSDSLVTGVLGFVGANVEPTIWVEGLDFDPSQTETLMAQMIAKAEAVGKAF